MIICKENFDWLGLIKVDWIEGGGGGKSEAEPLRLVILVLGMREMRGG